MNCLRTLSLVAVALAATLNSGQKVIVAAPQIAVAPRTQPFYLERAIFAFGVGGKVVRSYKEIVARRSDGSTARIRTFGVELAYSSRYVVFADGTPVTFMDDIKVKSTFPRMSEDELSQSRRWFTPTSDCGLAPPYQLLGRESLMGQETVVLQTVVNGRFRLTRALAPKLGCEDLYVKSEIRNPDGTFSLSAETKTDRIVTGEPDPECFNRGVDFQELPPSEAQRRMLQKINWKLTPEEARELEIEGQRADARYRR